MVLDGVLEVETGKGMLSGPAAYEQVHRRPPPTGLGALTALSNRALEYAASINIDDRTLLAGRLYAYNAVPISARWRRLLSAEPAVERYLGIESDGSRLAEREWERVPSYADGNGWFAWRRRRDAGRFENPHTYKLYISPTCSEMQTMFPCAIDAICASNAFHWKVGSNVHGLLRCDKMVVYFRRISDMQAAAVELLRALGSCPAQGVPFTAELGGNGLLSWGIDPPNEKFGGTRSNGESWRSRVCELLASAIVQARMTPGVDLSPVEFAMERLRHEGIDISSWSPTTSLTWINAHESRVQC
jgi:hypothetical protein